MKEIKFRAWDKLGKRLCPVLAIDFNRKNMEGNDYIGAVFLEINNKHYHFWFDKVILMQFTGFKDKNKKEIYESDLIKTIDGISKVVFINGCFCIHCYKYPNENLISLCEFIELYPQTGIKVIGNIYQNKELLK